MESLCLGGLRGAQLLERDQVRGWGRRKGKEHMEGCVGSQQTWVKSHPCPVSPG